MQIIRAAENVFGRRGIDAASIREIAKEANINIAMISYYFGSKNKLVECLFNWRISVFNSELEEISKNHSISSFDKLSEILRKFLDRILNNSEFHRIMVREYSKNNSILEVDDRVNDLKMKNLSYIDEIIEKGYNDGEFKRKAPAEAVIMVVIGSASYFILNEKTYLKLWGLSTHEEFSERIHEQYSPFLIDSLKAIIQYDEK
ncbi:TetR/AcrR family transcriptional regulator [Chishuiella sp.]|uniref:TetR/AcrR family transcriptional regulator n=1 Tax=Chishuiella sp. TaxID=1969467 RepID=UPI0028AA2958|nr:TetR/AcrR family transcriptional regulator [Chishuiella sp.]